MGLGEHHRDACEGAQPATFGRRFGSVVGGGVDVERTRQRDRGIGPDLRRRHRRRGDVGDGPDAGTAAEETRGERDHVRDHRVGRLGVNRQARRFDRRAGTDLGTRQAGDPRVERDHADGNQPTEREAQRAAVDLVRCQCGHGHAAAAHGGAVADARGGVAADRRPHAQHADRDAAGRDAGGRAVGVRVALGMHGHRAAAGRYAGAIADVGPCRAADAAGGLDAGTGPEADRDDIHLGL